jgi:hypothetical protein
MAPRLSGSSKGDGRGTEGCRGRTYLEGKKSIRAVVHIEKDRLVGKKASRLAETQLGKSVQNQLGASAALIAASTRSRRRC